MDIADLIGFEGLTEIPMPDNVQPFVSSLTERLDLFRINLINQLRAADSAVYTDADAVAAMGVIGVLNPLNHNRYTDAEAAAVVGITPPQAHKDSHDPQTGSDPLDCAAPSELAGVQAAGEGNADTLARSNHQHQIQHSIVDNHLVTIDHAAVADDDYAKFTADGLEGRSYTELRGDINVADGADVTGANAPQAHAGTHVTGGGDTVADVIAAGNSGLMSGADKTKLDGLSAGYWARAGTVLSPVTVGDEVHIENPTQSETFEIKKVDASALTTFKDHVTSVGTSGYGLNLETNKHIDFAEVTELDSVDNYAICGWAKQDVLDLKNGIYGFGAGAAGARLDLFTWDDGNMYVYHFTGGGNAYAHFDYSTAVTAGVWFHWAVVFDKNGVASSDKLKLYIDGVERVLTYVTPAGLTTTADMSGGSYVGRYGSALYWDGTIDEIAIWTESLTDNDILDLVAGGAGMYIDKTKDWPTDGGSQNANLQLLWHIDEGTGTGAVIVDSSDNSYTGTTDNIVEADWVTGHVGIPGVAKENTIFRSRDGESTGEFGSWYWGDDDLRGTLNGKTLRFQIGSVEVIQIDANGNLDLSAGRIASHHTTVTAAGPTDDLDVTNVNTVLIDTGSNNVTIGGLVGGVAGQILYVTVIDITNNATLEHNEGGGDQDIFLHAGGDETLTTEYGGWVLVCDGSSWFEAGQGA